MTSAGSAPVLRRRTTETATSSQAMNFSSSNASGPAVPFWLVREGNHRHDVTGVQVTAHQVQRGRLDLRSPNLICDNSAHVHSRCVIFDIHQIV